MNAMSGGVLTASKRNGVGRLQISRIVLASVASWLLISCLSVLLTHDALAQTNEESVAELFRRFVESPPPISRLVFEVERDGLKKDHRLFFSRWQTNGFLIQQIESADDIDRREFLPDAILGGRWGSSFWHHRLSGGWLTWTEEPESVHRLGRNEAYSVYRLYLDEVSRVLNGGAFNVAVGVVHWDGDSFSATSDMSGAHMTGRMRSSVDGKPLSLQLTSAVGGQTYNYTVKYKYERRLSLHFLPSNMDLYFVDTAGSENLQHAIRVREIETSETPLGSNYFLPQGFMEAGPKEVTYLQTNSQVYLVNSNSLVKVSVDRPDGPRLRRSAVLWAMAAITALFALLLIRGAKRTFRPRE